MFLSFDFQEIHILQSKKAEYHEMEHERDEAILRLRVGVTDNELNA